MAHQLSIVHVWVIQKLLKIKCDYKVNHALLYFSDLQGCYESVIMHPYNSRICIGAMRCDGQCLFTRSVVTVTSYFLLNIMIWVL